MTIRMSLRLDRGPDRGQNFGTLFEAPTADGAAVVGAGFPGVYNTYHRLDRHVLQWFIRPADGERSLSSAPMPRATDIAGTYLFDVDGEIFASSDTLRSWNPDAGSWHGATGTARERMRLGARHLHFEADRVLYDGQVILDPPELGRYQRFFYAHGHLCFYQVHWAGRDGYRLHTTDDEGFSQLWACPWSPGEPRVDLDRAVVLTLPVVGEVPFSFGQRQHEILTCSNIGGVYVFDGQAWKMIVEPEIDTSYQVYSMINHYDRLLLAQYPTGLLFEYSGGDVTPIEGWPPRMPGVSASVREAQTTAIYGGDLYVGVWPWAELWRYSQDTDRWIFVRRMLSHPEVTEETNHPYERESETAGYVANQWGQRITSLIPHEDGMLLSTSAKSPIPWEPKADFVSDGRWQEYGAVHRLRTSGHLSAPLRWTETPTTLDLVIDDAGLRIVQDGFELAAATLDAPALAAAARSGVDASRIRWREGLFGRFGGQALDGAISP